MKQNSSKSRKARARKKRRRILIGIFSLVAVCLLALLIDAAAYYGKVHGGITISGKDVGGLTRDEAWAAVSQAAKDSEASPITLVSGERTWEVLPADVGATVDVSAAISAAMNITRGSNFVVDSFRKLGLYFSGEDVALTGTIDTGKMDELIGGVAEEIDMPPVNAGLAFEGSTVKVVEGHKGRVVDQPVLRTRLQALLLSLHATELEIPMVVKDPEVVAENTDLAVSRAKEMIASPVTLRHGEKTWQLTTSQIAAYMDCDVEDVNGVATLVPYLSAAKMDPFFEKVGAKVNKKAVSASFKGDGEKAWVIPAETGEALEPTKTAEALTAAALEADGRVAEVVFETTQPELSTEEAEAMGITTKLASYSTVWEGSKARQKNVRVTTEYASNVILAPGEVYDFDKQIGPRTPARGYEMAPGITAGKLEEQLGGGICQVSTTLFNAAFEAGLEIVERRNHSLYIDHYPKGRDATVSAGGPNMRFKNDYKHHILIRGVSNGINTTFVIYGTPEGRTVESETGDFYNVKEMTVVTYPYSKLKTGTTEIIQKGQTGRSITVTRVVKDKDGKVIHDDKFNSTWKMMTQEVRVGTGGQTTTTTAKPPSSTTTTTPAATD